MNFDSKEFAGLLRQLDKSVDVYYKKLRALVIERLNGFQMDDGKLDPIALSNFLGTYGTDRGELIAIIKAESSVFYDDLYSTLQDALKAALAMDEEAVPLAVGQGDMIIKQVNRKLLYDEVSRFNLSANIWKLDMDAAQVIRNIALNGALMGESAYSVTKKLDGFLIREIPYTKYPVSVGRGVYRNARQNGKRVARTIMAESARMADIEYARSVGMKSLKWVLSMSHPCCDICDVLATQDKYHLGPGIYPIGKFPQIAHPHCLCGRELVVNKKE